MGNGENIVKFHRRIRVNIGLIVIGIIIIYIAFNVFSFVSSTNIAEYEVTQGTIATNNVYKGLVIRDETVYYAEKAGYINYYMKNGWKAGINNVIYSIDTTGEIASQISSVENGTTDLNADVMDNVVSEMSAFSDAYSPVNFQAVYNFKNDISSEIKQNLSTTALSSLGSVVDNAVKANTFYKVHPKEPGIVIYAVDGSETIKPENFTKEDLDFSNYRKTNLDSANKVNVADPVFKLISSEKWNVILPVSEEIVKKLKDKDSIKVRFCLDGYQTYASFSVIKKNSDYYLNLGFSNAMIRYVTERYLDVELVLDVESGLKIPNSAITEKEFFTIPKSFFTRGDNSGSLGVMVEKIVDGKKAPVFVTPNIYSMEEDRYYVDSEELHNGDVLVLNDSDKTYKVGSDTDRLKGVYNINKGYAVFKQIKILYQNNEYTIVDKKTDYGIDLYDHIALDSTKIKENELIIK